jgi:hypothetical protein
MKAEIMDLLTRNEEVKIIIESLCAKKELILKTLSRLRLMYLTEHELYYSQKAELEIINNKIEAYKSI